MFYTIYKTINQVNGKFYVGKHQTTNINDSYLGSGKALKEAIKKYGKHNFQKEILFVFDNEIDMNAKEKEIVTKEFISLNETYNMGIGGEGGPFFLNKTHSAEVRQSFAKKLRGRTKETHAYLAETAEKVSKKLTGRKNTEETIERMKAARQVNKEERNRKISEAVKNFYENKKVNL